MVEPTENDLKSRGRFTHKYNRFFATRKDQNIPHIKQLYNAYHNYTKEGLEGLQEKYDEDEKHRLFEVYYNAEQEYLMKYHDMTDLFITLSRHGVCLPMYFSDGTADWHKEKYGKSCSYAHAGEVFFIPTKDAIYLNINRHF